MGTRCHRGSEGFGHDPQVLGSQVVGHRPEHVVPERQHRAAALHHPGRPGQRPEVEVLRAVPPAGEVGARHAGDGLHRGADALQERTEPGSRSSGASSRRTWSRGAMPPTYGMPHAVEPGAHLPQVVAPDRVLGGPAVTALRHGRAHPTRGASGTSIGSSGRSTTPRSRTAGPSTSGRPESRSPTGGSGGTPNRRVVGPWGDASQIVSTRALPFSGHRLRRHVRPRPVGLHGRWR